MPSLMKIGQVNQTAVCSDETCSDYGKTMADHPAGRIHRPKILKGLKGTCPVCKGPFHNTHDAEVLIQMKCLIYQATGKDIRGGTLSANQLSQLATYISAGLMKPGGLEYATRADLKAAPKAVVVPVAGAPSATGTARPAAPAPASPAAPATVASSSPPLAPPTPTPVPTVSRPAPPPIKPVGSTQISQDELKRKLQAGLKRGALVPV